MGTGLANATAGRSKPTRLLHRDRLRRPGPWCAIRSRLHRTGWPESLDCPECAVPFVLLLRAPREATGGTYRRPASVPDTTPGARRRWLGHLTQVQRAAGMTEGLRLWGAPDVGRLCGSNWVQFSPAHRCGVREAHHVPNLDRSACLLRGYAFLVLRSHFVFHTYLPLACKAPTARACLDVSTQPHGCPQAADVCRAIQTEHRRQVVAVVR
jgi:hypothetical protein